MDCALGIDIGGTKIAMALVDPKGHIIASQVSPTSFEDPDADVRLIHKMFTRFKLGSDVTPVAIGVGVAGQIDSVSGTVLGAPNLRWSNFPLKKSLEAVFDLPVVVLNDVRAAALGEWKHGAGQGYDDLLCVLVGTGIGGAIVSGGKLQSGATNTAGEMGHMIIDIHGGKCSCGSRGCLETISSGWRIAERGREVFHRDSMTAKDVLEAWRRGDSKAQDIIADAMVGLVVGVSNVVNVVNPACIVVGGGIAMGFPEMIEILRREVPQVALPAAVARLQIVPAQLGAMSGVIGASTAAFTSIGNF